MNNSGMTLTDVRSEALTAIKELKNKDLDIQTAKEIREFLKIIIDTAKTQVSFLDAMPEKLKEQLGEEKIQAIAGTLRDRDAELDESLNQIDEKRKSVKIS